MAMVKFLICGNLEKNEDDSSGSAFSTLVKRVEALEKSSHGPFECLLVAGGLFQDERSYRESLGSSSRLPISTYAIDCPPFVEDGNLPANLTYLDRSGGEGSGSAGRKWCGISTIHKLTVCWVNDLSGEKNDTVEVQSLCGTPAYRGCDVLLSSSWPKNSHNFLNDKEIDELKTTLNIALGAGSESVSQVAVTCKPRYHFAGGDRSRAVFYQRTPYTNPGEVHATNAQAPATRMISLARAPLEGSPTVNSKDKTKKWMHALSLEPIVYLKPEEILGLPSASRCTECPYMESTTTTTGSKRPLDVGNVAVQQMDKRFKADGQGQGTGVFFFGGNANDLSGARVGYRADSSQRQQSSTKLTPPSSSAVKLFIGNLPRDYTQEQILRLLPGAVTMHRPLDKSKPRDPISGHFPLKNFCFVDFIEHAKAAKVVEASVNKGVLMGGRTVTVGWAADKQASDKERPPPPPPASSNTTGVPPPPPPAASLGSQPPYADATVLFLGNLPPLTRRMVNSSGEVEDGDEDLYWGPDVDSQLLQELHKKFIGIVSFNRVTSKRYAFVEFASHGEAYLAWQMAEGGGSTAGGAKGLKINNHVLSVAWASGSRQYNDGGDKAAGPAGAGASAAVLAKVAPTAQANVLLEAPDKECKTLFLGNVPPGASDQQLLGLMDQVTKALKIRPDEEAGGAEVRHPEGKQFAFLTFPSHEVTAEIMAARSIVGGMREQVPEWKDPSEEATSTAQTMVGAVELRIADRGLTLGWAKGKGADRRVSRDIGNAGKSGKKAGFGDDHASDCWFCLASGNLRTHLVLSVAEHSYLAMPRGALHPLHCLVSSIQCVPSKSHLSTAATGEFKRYEGCLGSLYGQEGMALMSFERAIRTRGKDHMQQHFVPVPAALVEGAEEAFHAVIKGHNDRHRERGGEGEPLLFVEVSDEETRGVEELVLALPGGPFQEYFAFSLPSLVSVEDEKGNSGVDWVQKRFIYAHDTSSSSSPDPESNERREGYSWRFPMQLGTELAANILKEPNKAFWKDCVVSEEEEVALSASFKRKFDPLDFTVDH